MLKKRLYHFFVLVILSPIITLFIATADANQAPIAQNQSVTTDEDTSKAITLIATDADTNPLTYTIVSGPSHGTLTGTPPRVTYKPAANYNGADSFTFKANDGMVDSNIAAVSITVVAVNDAPAAKNQSVSTNRSTAKIITLVATDADGDPLTYQTVAQPAHGALLGAPPSVTYTPAAGYSGSDSFTFKANDGKVDSNVATVSITVINHAPVAQNQSVTTNKNTAKAISLGSTDADKDPLTYQVIAQPAHGTLSGTPPSVTYTPAAGYSGSDSFTFKANDGIIDSNVATVSIAVVNRVPVAQNQSLSTNKNTAKAITLTATDADGDPLTYQVVTQPAHGILSGTPPGVTYTPAASYSGSDSFSFKANDGKVDSNIATISITVVNHTPVAQNQSVSTNRNTAKSMILVATDSDKDPLTYQIVTQPGHGGLTGSPPNVTYTPAAGYSGSDSFTFKTNDGKVDSNTATISITVVNHAPVAQKQSVSTNRNTPKSMVLVATDSDKDPLTYQIVTQPEHGGLTGSPPNVTYTPAAGYSGLDSFTFKANDGKIDSNIATVSITAVNHVPVAQNQSVTTNEDIAKAVTLVASDSDGDKLTYAIVALPAHGTLTSTLPSVTYTPTSHYYGSDSFTFKTNDGKADSNTATISITVTHVNHAPVAQNQSVTTNEDTAKAITLVATDPDGDKLTYTVVGQPAHGSLSGTPPSVTYKPTAHYYGSDNITFKAKDGKLDSNVATVSISATHVNHPPVAQDQSVTVIKDSATLITLSAADLDGDSLTYQISTQPTHGTLSGTPPGVTYNPASGYSGLDSFTFMANDGKANSNGATVSIAVSCIITTVAGNGEAGSSGDGGPAIVASLGLPVAVAADASGNFHISEYTYHRIRKVDSSGIITTYAGDGSTDCWFEGRATSVGMEYPHGLAVDVSGNLYIADPSCNRVRKVNMNGMLNIFAGSVPPCCNLNRLIGGYAGDGGPATAPEAAFDYPEGVAADALGNLYIADTSNDRIRKVDVNGILTTVAGNGSRGYSGDGGPATDAMLNSPERVALDVSGNLYIVDSQNDRIRKVNKTGIISTVAGNGISAYSGDGGPATLANLGCPSDVAVDSLGNLYIADTCNQRIRKVGTNGIITTVAGNGSASYSGDGGPATQAALRWPEGVAVDPFGNLYIADSSNYRIRKVESVFVPPNGRIAGHVRDSYTALPLSDVSITIANHFNIYQTKTSSDGSYAVSSLPSGDFTAIFLKSGYIQQAVEGAISADAAQTLDIQLVPIPSLAPVAQNQSVTVGINESRVIALAATDPNGDTLTYEIMAQPAHGTLSTLLPRVTYTPAWYYSGTDSFTFRAYDGQLHSNLATVSITVSSIISTVAGNGSEGFGGDGGPAINAMFGYPEGLALDVSGNIYIADTDNQCIRKVDPEGIITTIAGNGSADYGGDRGPALNAMLDQPSAVAADNSGLLYIADGHNYRIRKVNTSGVITTSAGNGAYGFSGDGGLSTNAMLSWPVGVALDASGAVYIADASNKRIRKVNVEGIITTVAGNGKWGYGGDGGPATNAMFEYPKGIAVDLSGSLYIADTDNNRIRKVSSNGIITTVAGNGSAGYSGDGGPATQATLYGPSGVAVDSLGSFYIADLNNNVVRKVDKNGIITPAAGGGRPPDNLGDGGPATEAELDSPSAVALDALGNLYIMDTGNNRIRKVWGVFFPETATIKGEITDSSTGLSLSNVTVTIKDSLNISYTAKTFADGTYMISGMTPGNFKATFAKSGYAQQTVNGISITHALQTLDIRLASIPSLYLAITSPQDGAIVNSSPVSVTGNVSLNSNVTVNGISAPVNTNTFTASITLSEGLNSITATAADQYGQTASQSITITLLSKGNITGMVKDSSTGLSLSAVTVSVIDFLNYAQTVSTNGNGKYTISGIASGAFNGSTAKGGYTTNTFSGTMVPGQTVTVNFTINPIVPVISTVSVSWITTNSAMITWTTDQPADSLVNYGTTLSYGSSVRDSTLATSHTIILSNLMDAATYHFKVTSKNIYAFSSSSPDGSFTTVRPSPISLVITFPMNNDTISRSDTLVKGTVVNSTGSETGVVVNGLVAHIYGNSFAVNHVPLGDGPNTIIATATDTSGNTQTASISVTAASARSYIKLTSNTEVGLSPLEATLTIYSSLDLTNAQLNYIGPGQVESFSTSVSEYTVRMTVEGIYYFKVTVADSGGGLYSDTVAITVLSKAEIDNLLRAKWEGMRSRLSSSDVEGALLFLDEDSKQDYRELFTILSSMLPTVSQDLLDIQLIEYMGNAAIYDIRMTRDGIEYSFQLLFTKDINGVWWINSF